MALEFEEWFEVHKLDVFRCYAKKGNGFKQDCHADEQNLEHIKAHDSEHALRIFKDYVNTENNKEEARKQKEAQEKRLETIENMLSQIITEKNGNSRQNHESINNENIAISNNIEQSVNTADMVNFMQQSINVKFGDCPVRSKHTTFENLLKSVKICQC